MRVPSTCDNVSMEPVSGYMLPDFIESALAVIFFGHYAPEHYLQECNSLWHPSHKLHFRASVRVSHWVMMGLTLFITQRLIAMSTVPILLFAHLSLFLGRCCAAGGPPFGRNYISCR